MRYFKWVIIVLISIVLLFLLLTYMSVPTTEKRFTTCELLEDTDMDVINFRLYDSVLISPSHLYTGSVLKNIMQGEQYRKAWSTPVKFPLVFIDTFFGGMRILEEGGGKQTHSLKAESVNGQMYSFRSINKDPEALIPDFAEAVGIENIIVDGISAQHPYAALVVARLAENVDILHTDPRIFFLPKQDGLGDYNSRFGNRIYLLEHETEGGSNWTKYDDAVEILDTEDLQKLKLELSNLLIIDERALIRARLFDILIGDWDRHAKQWGWVI